MNRKVGLKRALPILPLFFFTMAPAKIKPTFKISQETPAKDEQIVWRSKHWRLTLPKKNALTLTHAPTSEIHAVIRYRQGTPLEKHLQGARQTLFTQNLNDQGDAIALVSVRDLQELDPFAQAAHADGDFSCGRVEVLDLTTAFADSTSPLPPIYSTEVTLPEVQQLITEPNSDNLKNTISQMESMGTRHHNTTRGQNAPTTLKSLFETAGSGIANFSTNLVVHSQTSQSSLVASIPGTDNNAAAVIIGAHLDSINRTDIENAPGADDDASGIATLLETVRVIKESGVHFKRPIEFHAYAAEEVGLIGSGEIAKIYKNSGRQIAAMMQLDMTAYASNSQTTIYLADNDTSTELRRAVKNLLNNYLGGDYIEGTLTAGTSDHRSWYRQGYAAVFPFESLQNYNHLIHTANDLSTALTDSQPLAERFAKLTLAFLSHYAGLVEAETSYNKLSQSSASLGQDLKVAITSSKNAANPLFMVATPNTLAHVDICPVTTHSDLDCQGERTPLDFMGARNNRNVFWNSQNPLSLTSGQKWRLMGYDNSDHLMAVRDVTFQ